MSTQCEVKNSTISTFARYLSAWVALCLAAGVLLGQLLPQPFEQLAAMEIAQVNLPVGRLIWVMIIPMLLKIDFSALHQIKQHVRGIGVTLFINWAVKPFSMHCSAGYSSGICLHLTCHQQKSILTSSAYWSESPPCC